MMRAMSRRAAGGRRGTVLAAVATALACCGCVTSTRHSIPAHCLPAAFRALPRDARVPIDYTMLRQPATPSHLIGPGDVLGIHIQDVIGGSEEPTAVYFPPPFANVSSGNPNPPAVGAPFRVGDDGRVVLPQVPPIRLIGLTLAQATDVVRRAYTVDHAILRPDRARVTVTLIRPRSYHVLVVREDTPVPNGPATRAREAAVLAKRGSSHVLDLPAHQNDLLHALSLTGGLPGLDARSEVVVLRGASDQWGGIMEGVDGSGRPVLSSARPGATRIPLRLAPWEALPFGPSDVLLRDGDVVVVESRESEHFFTGGLLPGGQYPLPRDYALDVLGAMAIAGGSPGGSAPTISGPNGVFPPTRILVLRTLPGGKQVKIHVDVNRALQDPAERLVIQPRDLIMLQYTPGQILGNYALGIFGLRYNYNQINGTATRAASTLPFNGQ